MNLLVAKISLLVTVGFATLAASIVPWLATSCLASRRALDLIAIASAMSAGVVVGALLCHLLPEANRSFTEYLELAYDPEGKVVAFPFAGLICGCTLAALVSVDALIVRHGVGGDEGHHHGEGSGHDHSGGAPHDHITASLTKLAGSVAANAIAKSPSRDARGTDSERIPLRADGFPPATFSTGSSAHVDEDSYGSTVSPPSSAASAAPSGSNGNSLTPASFHMEVEAGSVESAHRDYAYRKAERARLKRAHATATAAAAVTAAPASPAEYTDSDSAAASAGPPAPSKKELVRAWVFFVALSLHGVLDGLSVGSEQDQAGFASILVAVLSHKLFDGLSLGCAMFPAQLPRSHRWTLLVISAMTTPLGIGLGIAAESLADDTHMKLVVAIVLSMASGSFAFISLMELLPSSLASSRFIGTKLVCFCAGLLGMASLAIVL